MDFVELKEPRKGLEPDRLLFTKRNATVNTYPFFYGCIDNYFPETLYRNLLNTFPKEMLRINYKSGLTLADDNSILKEFWHKSPLWKVLLDFFSSELFLQDLQKFITPACIRDRGERVQRKWHYIHDWSVARRSVDVAPIKINFKFSHLTAGEWSPPHTDLPCKLFSIILYFPEPDWCESYGGGTEIYQPKYSVLNNNWYDVYAPFELMNRWHSLDFVPNRLVFLLKTKNSWHGVSPLTCPSGKKRRSLLISFHNDIHGKRSPKERFYRWVTHRLIRSLMRFEPQTSQ